MTREQAEGVMTVLAEAVDESIRSMEAGLVSKAEQEKVSSEDEMGRSDARLQFRLLDKAGHIAR